VTSTGSMADGISSSLCVGSTAHLVSDALKEEGRTAYDSGLPQPLRGC
jgi:hypothetical protein